MIERNGEGLTVTMWDGWPRSLTIKGENGTEARLFGTPQIRALHFMLGEVLAADPEPDDRPRRESRVNGG